jgi:hypothetical protein
MIINLIKKSFLLSCFSQVKWHEVCLHVPAAIKEVLLAWEHGAVTANDVKRILDAMRSRMCCLPVCAAAWLCSYMQVSVFSYRNVFGECACLALVHSIKILVCFGSQVIENNMQMYIEICALLSFYAALCGNCLPQLPHSAA